ncbi:MAG: hypothetical protein AB7U47_05170 [Variibacter sp.]
MHPRPDAISSVRLGHNGGPALTDGPEWEDGDPYHFTRWKRAWTHAWKRTPREIALRRDDKAEALDLTYEEYTLEILERGRYLQATDAGRIAAIKRRRRSRA